MLRLEHDFLVRVHYLMARMPIVNFFQQFSQEVNGEDGKSEFQRQIELVYNEFCFLEKFYHRVWNYMTRGRKLKVLGVAWFACNGLYEKFRKDYGLDRMNLEFNPHDYCLKYNLDAYPDGPFSFENLKTTQRISWMSSSSDDVSRKTGCRGIVRTRVGSTTRRVSSQSR